VYIFVYCIFVLVVMCRLRNGGFNVFDCVITVCRYNLDPFNNYKDEELWLALEKTYMKDTVKTYSIQGPQSNTRCSLI